MKRILILGGGFGGVYTAIHLEKILKNSLKNGEIELSLVNRDNYFVYQPMLAEVIGGAVGIFDTVSALQRLLPKTNLHIREIEQIDLEKKEVILIPQFTHTSTRLPFDHLILALGNVTDFRENPGLHEHALPFKNLSDTTAIRNRVLEAVSRAALESDPSLRKQLLTFVIGGGGYSGTEIAAEINDFVKILCKETPNLSLSEAQIILISHKTRLLDPELPEDLGNYAGNLLAKRGVDLRFGRKLITATPEGALLDDNTYIPSKTVISSVPSSPNPLIEALNLPKQKGRVETNPFLQVEGYNNIWALGDCAAIPSDSGLCPPTAQFAVRQAKQLAKNLAAEIFNQEKKPFRFKAIGSLGALGHRSAVAELFGRFKFSGFLAWILWRFIYWLKLPGIDRKIKVGISWFLDLFVRPEAIELKLSSSQGIIQLHYETGETIFNEGDFGDYLYIITSGEVEVFNKKGKLATLGPGQYFGEMALLNQTERIASIKCLKPTNVLALSKKDFGSLLANFKELKENFEQTEKARRWVGY